jgi:hypothetical protein
MGVQEGHSPSSKISSPFPFVRGRGIQGDGVRTTITGNSELVVRNEITNQNLIEPHDYFVDKHIK